MGSEMCIRDRVYLYLETENKPEKTGVLQDNKLNTELDTIRGNNACVALYFGDKAQVQKIRYGISFISEEQAKSNMEREQKFYDVNALAEAGKKVWNDALGKIEVQSPDENEKTIFYTSLYRCYERPVNISEDGRYFSAFDGKVHEDGGNAFYTDDWIWDTYRATHPLRVLIDTLTETNVIRSYILMAEQMGDMWMPTFPEITGDSRRMNSNHAVATVADAYAKGLRGFDLEKAYLVCKKGIEEKTLAPWSGKPAGWLDDFYKKNGYIPALAPGEKETVPEVHHFEKRQPIAVTLGTSYDQWCLSQIAEDLGKKDDAEHYLKCSYNYRNVYNPETQFFHPKDKKQGEVWQFSPMDVSRGDLKKQVANVIKPLAIMYRFQSLGEYRALLSLYNIRLEKVERNNQGNKYTGLVYLAIPTTIVSVNRSNLFYSGNPIVSRRWSKQ